MRQVARVIGLAGYSPRRLLSLGALGFLTGLLAQAGELRKATIEWRPIPLAKSYEIEISPSAGMSPVVWRKQVTTPRIQFEIAPGSYYYHLRGVTRLSTHGKWSDPAPLIANAFPPKLISPEDGLALRQRVPESGVLLKWQPGIAGSKYVLELSDNQGPFMKRSLSAAEFAWKPFSPGRYGWRVGYESPGGDEWGEGRSFVVEESALMDPQSIKAAAALKEKEEESKALASGPPEVYLLTRLGQSVVAYNSTDQDTGRVASGAATVGIYSAELRWRQAMALDRSWNWSGSLNLEAIRQIVLGNDFFLPRGYVRAVYGHRTGRWRIGPMLQFNIGYAGIFVPQSETVATQARVLRKGYGAGAAATYRASDTLFVSGIGLLRIDTGGESSILPSPLKNSLGFEVGFGMAISFSRSWLLEGRLRAVQETYAWNPASTTASGPSSLSNLYVILDLGIGLKF